MRRDHQVFQNSANPPRAISLSLILMRAVEFKYMIEAPSTFPNIKNIQIHLFPNASNVFKLNIDGTVN